MDSVTGRNEATISVNVSVEHVKLVVVKFVLLFSPLRVIYDYTNGVGRGGYSGNGSSELNRVINKCFYRYSLKFTGNVF